MIKIRKKENDLIIVIEEFISFCQISISHHAKIGELFGVSYI
jgi:hypothetical protein